MLHTNALLLTWLSERMPIGLLWTRAGHALELNAEAARIYGARRRELTIGDWTRGFTSFGEAGRAVPLDQQPLMRALTGESVPRVRMEILRADGERLEVLSQAYPLFEGRRQDGAVCLCEDISWAVERERQCDDWMAALGHEVRGAIHVADLAIRNSKARSTTDPEHARQDLEL